MLRLWEQFKVILQGWKRDNYCLASNCTAVGVWGNPVRGYLKKWIRQSEFLKIRPVGAAMYSGPEGMFVLLCIFLSDLSKIL
jgi:hypothetical protein